MQRFQYKFDILESFQKDAKGPTGAKEAKGQHTEKTQAKDPSPRSRATKFVYIFEYILCTYLQINIDHFLWEGTFPAAFPFLTASQKLVSASSVVLRGRGRGF